MSVPLVLFGIGSVSILIIFFIGVLFEKPYIELLAGAFGMSVTLGFLADGSLCTATAYSSGFQCQSSPIGIYAMIPTAFSLVCFVIVIVQYREYKGTSPFH